MRRSISLAIAAAVLLAGCGGRGASLVPPASQGASSPRQAQSTNVEQFGATLWYGDGTSLLAVPLKPTGTTAEIDGLYAAGSVARAMTVAPDGTVYDLAQTGGGSGWRLQMYAPGSHGSAVPEEHNARSGEAGLQVTLVGDGIDVLTRTGPPCGCASDATLKTFAYGTGNNAAAVRKLDLGPGVSDIASDVQDRIYVAHNDGLGIMVYAAGARTPASPIRRIALNMPQITSVAVAADGTVYALNAIAGHVKAFAPGANGPAASRALQLANGTPTGGITVDQLGRLYVGMVDAGRNTRVDVYAPDATGTAAPLRSVAAPSRSGLLTSIALGPPSTDPVASQTLYVSGDQRVNAFPATADGTTAPLRTITGFTGATFTGPMATAADGQLYVARQTGITPKVAGCSIVVERADANGTNGLVQTFGCGAAQGISVARGLGGEVDVLGESPFSQSAVVSRFNGGQLTGTFAAFAASGLATDVNGDLFLATSNHVDEYAAAAVTGDAPIRTVTFATSVFYITVAPDGTLYAASQTQDSITGAGSWTVHAVAPGATAPSRAIGPFVSANIETIATDADNELYVALTSADAQTNQVNVYLPTAAGNATPVRTLLGVLPAGAPINSITVGP